MWTCLLTCKYELFWQLSSQWRFSNTHWLPLRPVGLFLLRNVTFQWSRREGCNDETLHQCMHGVLKHFKYTRKLCWYGNIAVMSTGVKHTMIYTLLQLVSLIIERRFNALPWSLCYGGVPCTCQEREHWFQFHTMLGEREKRESSQLGFLECESVEHGLGIREIHCRGCLCYKSHLSWNHRSP